VQLDVTDAAAVQSVVDDVVAQHGRLDLMVNNAGIVYAGETHNLSRQQWDRLIDVNLRGVAHGVQAAYPHMVAARRGQIVNTASNAGLIPTGLLSAYSATKFGVVGLSVSLRTEAKRYGVGVSVVCPGVIDTPILDKGAVGGFRGRAFYDDLARSRPPYPAERLAEDVLEGVRRNKAVIVAPAEARWASRAYRLAPTVTHRLLTLAVSREQAKMAEATRRPRAVLVAERLAATRQGAWLVIHVLNPIDRFVMARTKGKRSPRAKGLPKLLLHHVGAKTGQPRQTPLMCIPMDDHWVVVASKGGDAKHPAWYFNVTANPAVTIDLDGETIPVQARELTGDEYRATWQRARAQFSGFDTYQHRAGDRTIPLIRLDRRGP
jgi:deazaflavin-dependent oxidoreductase (nitroreductase family)